MKSSINQYSTALLFCTLIFALLSCEKTDDYSKISKNYQYKASFSIPVGNSSLSLSQMGYNLPLEWIQFPQLLEPLSKIDIRDTLPFDLSTTINEITRIKQIIIRLKSENEFPAKVLLNLHFANENLFLQDSLKQGPVTINAAKTDNDGKVLEKGTFLQDFTISSEQLSNWGNIRYMILIGYIENNVDSVKQYSTYNQHILKVEIATRVDFDFNLNTMP